MHLLRNKPAGRFSPVCLFRPDSIAVVGGGSEVGAQVTENLRAGGFKGGMLHADTAEGIEVLPSAVDLAVIATPPSPQILRALAAKGTFAAVVVCDADGLTDPEFRGRSPCAGAGLVRHRCALHRAECLARASGPARWPDRTCLAIGVAVSCGGGLGGAEWRRLQPHRRHRRPRRHRLRPGAGLAVARSRYRGDTDRYQAAAESSSLSVSGPRRVAAAAGGGDPGGRLRSRTPAAPPTEPSRRRCAGQASCASPASRTCWRPPRSSPEPGRSAARH